MTRRPRRKFDHLVSRKLLTFSYLQMGIIQTCGGFMCYYLVMNDFGFQPYSLNGLVLQPYLQHNASDTYNASGLFYGNSNVSVDCTNPDSPVIQILNNGGYHETSVTSSTGTRKGVILDWLFTNHLYQDLRMGFIEADCSNTVTYVKSLFTFGQCLVHQISPVTDRPVCYSTEALKYAQTSFFFSICATQFSNSLSCKTRKLSLAYQGFRNYFMIFGWSTEIALTFFLSYLLPINYVFQTRDVMFIHYALPSLPFSMMMLFYDEARKYAIRNYDGFRGFWEATIGGCMTKKSIMKLKTDLGGRDLKKEN